MQETNSNLTTMENSPWVNTSQNLTVVKQYMKYQITQLGKNHHKKYYGNGHLFVRNSYIHVQWKLNS